MYSIQKNSKLTYIIQLNNSSSTIIKSIQPLSFLNTKIKYQEIEIYTNNIQPIKPKQNHEMIYKLIQCLCEQQEHLQSFGYSFYTFHLEDIIMTDNNFFCLNDRNICKITNENTFSLFFPFSKNSTTVFTPVPKKAPFGKFKIVCKLVSSNNCFLKAILALSVFLKKVFFITTPHLPPILSILIKC